MTPEASKLNCIAIAMQWTDADSARSFEYRLPAGHKYPELSFRLYSPVGMSFGAGMVLSDSERDSFKLTDLLKRFDERVKEAEKERRL